MREGPPFESPKRTAGAFRSHGRGPAPPFWIILPALLTARHCCARTQSAARLPSLAPHGVRRGCWMNRLAGTRGEATYTALTLRSACSHSSCKPAMCGVKGQSPSRSLGGPRGPFSHVREWPPYSVQRHRRCLSLPRRARETPSPVGQIKKVQLFLKNPLDKWAPRAIMQPTSEELQTYDGEK